MPDVVQSKGKGDMMTEAKIVFWDVEHGRIFNHPMAVIL